jgi:hypothetical protein
MLSEGFKLAVPELQRIKTELALNLVRGKVFEISSISPCFLYCLLLRLHDYD